MFESFPKIARLKRNIVITEKIDGTNAQVHIVAASDHMELGIENVAKVIATNADGSLMLAGSRNRYVTPGDDNFGFAKWVQENAEELFTLGAGRHYGEWYGRGIQRTYGLEEKRFALFNVHRWADGAKPDVHRWADGAKPSCCETVPVLYRGDNTDTAIDNAMNNLFTYGTFLRGATGVEAEGIIVYHEASRTYFKRTFEYDEKGKPE